MTAALNASEARAALVRERLPEHLGRLGWSTERIAAHQRDALRRLLRTAIDHSPFHTARLHGVDAERFELSDLASLPIMTKAEMMTAYDDVVTDRMVTRARVEEHLSRTGWDAEVLDGRYVVMASGGSSGLRGMFTYTSDATAEFLLGCVRPGLARLLAVLGEMPADPVTAAFVGAPAAVHTTRILPSLFSGGLIDVTSIAATDPLESIVQRVNDLQPLLLQGHPTLIRKLAEEKLAGRLRISPLGVTTTSESLSPEDRARIDEAFGVGVVDTFGSSEGLMGVSAPDDPAIVLASDLAIVELVDAANRPVEVGTPSAKVLVTCLFNALQPLIRYELTDSFTRLADSPEHGHVRVRVEGRADDEFTFDDVVVHPIVVRSIMVKTPAVLEYQVRQTTRGIAVSVVAPDGLDAGKLESLLTNALRDAGLEQPDVDVNTAEPNELIRHPETGKTRRFIPLPRSVST
jgi:phenylacetate-CoA ligase